MKTITTIIALLLISIAVSSQDNLSEANFNQIQPSFSEGIQQTIAEDRLPEYPFLLGSDTDFNFSASRLDRFTLTVQDHSFVVGFVPRMTEQSVSILFNNTSNNVLPDYTKNYFKNIVNYSRQEPHAIESISDAIKWFRSKMQLRIRL